MRKRPTTAKLKLVSNSDREGDDWLHSSLLTLEQLGCKLGKCGLQLPDGGLSEENSVRVGRVLFGLHSAQGWGIGDWWADVEHRYGSRILAAASEDWPGGLTYQTCANYASVARAFAETSRRRELLKFGHHEVVASLPPDEADALLDFAEKPIASGGQRRTIRELRAEKQRRKDAFFEQKAQALAARMQVASPADDAASMAYLLQTREANIHLVQADREGDADARAVVEFLDLLDRFVSWTQMSGQLRSHFMNIRAETEKLTPGA
jgi:hypothetical protein